ncbi:MAG TPA: nucleotide sugar dehydrogenase [Dongiaceae bacterium]|jgi:GDP-mannose 6-dehydrogenase|nr:nucleotide sugar dehydrogenase [Dongiaceae bacterium]
MRISIFGIGYVGAVSAACLAADGHDVAAVDTNPHKVKMLNDGVAPIVEAGLAELVREGVRGGRLRATTDVQDAISGSDASIVCVGTPSRANGDLDLTQVARVCESIGAALARKNAFHAVIVRSTMLPGSMRGVVQPALEKGSGKQADKDFGLAIFPEFLREGSAIRDYREAGTVIIGVSDPRTEGLLREINKGLPGQIHVTDLETAEAVKYANNAWHAAKIVFANEVGSFCKAHGIDSHKVMEIVCADRRLNVSTAYMRPGFAYGGSCLPKDLRAVRYRAKQRDLPLPMLNALTESNDGLIEAVAERVMEAGNRRIGMIGLSFKGGTDDLRESPAVALAERLFGKGYDLKIFDANVNYSKLMGSNLSYIQQHIPHLSERLTDDLLGVVQHGQTLVVTHTDLGGAPMPALRPEQTVIDLVRLPGLANAGGQYVGLHW